MRLPVAALAAAVLAVACSDDGGSEAAFCATARGFAEDNPATVFDRYDPEDPAGAASLLRGEAERLRDWAGDAPGDVDGDVEVIAQAAEDLADAFEDPSPTPGRRDELVERFTQVEDASARVVSYVRERCAVELDPAGAAPTVTPTTTPTTPTTPTTTVAP